VVRPLLANLGADHIPNGIQHANVELRNDLLQGNGFTLEAALYLLPGFGVM
jgi:hypothetical protein